MNKRFAILLLGVAAIAFAGVAIAQSPLIDQRKQGMQGLGRSVAAVVPMMRAENQQPWNAQAAAAAMTTVRDTAGRIPAWFPPGSGPAQGVQTRALPAIWENKPVFDTFARNLGTIAGELLASAQANNEAAFRSNWARLGQACGACHTPYRAPQ
jgi:cytochrome c556